MYLKVLLAGAAVAATFCATEANASVNSLGSVRGSVRTAGDGALVVGSGWQTDTANADFTPSVNSPWTFTVAAGKDDLFSLTDAFVPGDIYAVTVNGGAAHDSSFVLLPTPFNNNLGPFASDFAPAWLDPVFSRLQLTFGPGSYSLSIADIHDAGLPAGFGLRLDAVPEPSTWVMMALGFAGLAFAGYRARRSAIAIA
ncbi:MAG TPA: PEP-CTERM sorting domain-containing protein [Roseiarcus sp.]